MHTLVCIDTGTTNTRVWLLDGDAIVARREAAVGARDTARDGHNGALAGAVHDLVREIVEAAPKNLAPASAIAAAGMITSPQGLHEVPHLEAPAGLRELAAAAQCVSLTEVSPLPFLFVPGVKTTERPGFSGLAARDLMRGEETLCLGLLQQGVLAPGAALLNLGSHWKLVRLDEKGRIRFSVTSIGGEMLQAVRTQTILASALPAGPLEELDEAMLRDGMDEACRSGLARALFCVRLHEQSGASTAQGRLSFALGAFIGAELPQIEAVLGPGTPVTVAGGEKACGAWARALEGAGHPVRSLTPAQVEAGLLAGLRAVAGARVTAGERAAARSR